MAYTLTEVLDIHNLPHNDDDVREQGIIRACLGCGSVTGINPKDGEQARIRTRDNIDWDSADCCPDSNDVFF